MPWDSIQRRQLENRLIEHMQLFGYELIDIPHIEMADIFLTRAGDKIIDRLFTFERHGKLLALRPEFTAAAARRYVQNNYTNTVRWQFSGTIFEDDANQPDHNYQSRSMGAELIGLAGSSAEAEIIAMAATGIDKAGFEDWQIVTGHVGLQQHLIRRFNIDSRTYHLLLAQRDNLLDPQNGKASALQQIQQVLPGYEVPETQAQSGSTQDTHTEHMLDILLDSTQYGTTMGGRTRQDIAHRLLQKHERAQEHQQIQEALDFLAEWMTLQGPADQVFREIRTLVGTHDTTAEELLQSWQVTIDRLEAYDIPQSRIIVQPNLVRNWEYYTGLVFAVRGADGRLLAGGGRYNELTRLVGGTSAKPAVGFAYYMKALMQQVPHQQALLQAITTPDTNEGRRIATYLRAYNIPVRSTPQDADTRADIRIEGNTIYYQNKQYTFDTIDQLITDIKRLAME
jgi:histidyl-tRNA synthetase